MILPDEKYKNKYIKERPDVDTPYCFSDECIQRYLYKNDVKYRAMKNEYDRIKKIFKHPRKEFLRTRLFWAKEVKVISGGVPKENLKSGLVECPDCRWTLFWEYA